MTPVRFAILLACVIAAAGITIAAVFAAGLPLVGVGTAALLGSLILGWRGRMR